MRFLAALAASPTVRPASAAAPFPRLVLSALELHAADEDIVTARYYTLNESPLCRRLFSLPCRPRRPMIVTA